ncbi:MAG: methyltransferase domain-containing protein [bacterium]|nr:methyltransferase domain-containing protein [bacterium]
MDIDRFSFLDRPLEETLELDRLLAATEVPSDDVGLRFYLEVLGLEHLHYGLWDEADSLSLEGMRAAQKRYLDRLLGLIPDGAKRVLDVGSGAGGNARALKKLGYEVEGLSPDASHGERFRAATGFRFHKCRFEDFKSETPFDLVLMSESAQYVPLERLFPAVERVLEPTGSLLVSDYFPLVKDGSYIVKSGHLLADFFSAAEAAGFALEHEEDVTEQVAPTLDLACQLADRYLFPTLRLAFLRGGQKKPRLTRAVARFLRKRLRRVGARMENIDSRLFREKKRYLICRFSRAAGPG